MLSNEHTSFRCLVGCSRTPACRKINLNVGHDRRYISGHQYDAGTITILYELTY